MRHQLAVNVYRDPHDPDRLNYTVHLTWWYDGKGKQSGTRGGSRLMDQGDFVCLEPISDVLFVLTELAHHVSISAHGPGDAPGSPGRERSGVDNVPTLEQLPLEPQSEPATATS